MLGFERIIDTLRRQWPIIGAVTTVALGLVVAYLLTAAPMYTATARILMDTRQAKLLDKESGFSSTLIDPGFVESQVEILTSDDLILSIVRALRLDHDTEFVGSGDGVVGATFRAISHVTGTEGPASRERLERTAVDLVKGLLKVERVGVTYVLSVSFRSLSGEKAAQIANAISDAYIVGGLEAKYQSTKRAGEWLQKRSVELREQSIQADRTVQTFKSDNNIIGTSRGLMSEQQLTDVNSQLVQARAATAEAKARLDRIEAITDKSLAQPTVTDALNNNVITRLRAQYLDVAAQYADISSRFGKSHQAATNLAARLAELRKSVTDEVNRIADAYRSDYEIAKNREQSLEENLNALVKQAGSSSQAQVELRNLESSADTYRNLYNNFLEKLQQATQQETFPITDARVISTAVKPDRKSSPKTALFLIGGIVAGLCVGVGVAFGRELFNDVFRTVKDVEEYLGLKCLGILPIIETVKKPVKPGKVSLRPGAGTLIHATEPGRISHFVVDHPFSRYAETLRNIKVSIDVERLSQEMRVIGIVSSLPKEGKTTVSANLGLLTAMTGHRTLLIDGDLHTQSLTRSLAPDAKSGLIEVLADPNRVSECIHRISDSGLDLLPAVIKSRMVNSADIIASQSMANLLKVLRDRYEFIFIDLAPIVPVTDSKAASHLVDGIVYVIEWGRTSRTAVNESLSSADVIQDKVLGILLNRADPRMLKRIEAYKGAYYSSYYVEKV